MTRINTSPQLSQTAARSEHQSFSLLADELRFDASAQFMALTLDLSQGIKTCLSLIHASHLAREEDDDAYPPMLNVADTEGLTRMAMAAAGVLSERAGSHIDILNASHMKAGEQTLSN
ncbi:hypothetical protein SAMN04515618_11270 [Collimonas sp. OK307]|uniref:hypothetical protein n=1 Tax=Collimonas sp. OK307 TaxID=1801620 RepID=UPI0008EDDCD4|nr:hypothetical protein [Collimonas sp. OK307]SFI17022.1 hypothetical protein SAMN04515618_11270 [Collimonas sp. OK307]